MSESYSASAARGGFVRNSNDEEMAVMEQRLLELTQQLGSEVARRG